MSMFYVYTLADCLVYLPDGGIVTLHENEVWPADDPFVAAHPEQFAASPIKVRNTVGFVAGTPIPLAQVAPRKAGPGFRKASK